MNPETPKTPEQAFKSLYQKIIDSEEVFVIENIEGLSKVDFLKYLSETGKFLFHGTNSGDIKELEPRQANCRSKKFGNLKGVYATQDSVLPIFHSIFNKKYFRGVYSSGLEFSDNEIDKGYVFKVDGEFEDKKQWTDGCVYILDKTKFEQGTDDDGKPIDEFVSREPIKPSAKMFVSPEDFPYLNEVEFMNK